MKAKIKGSILSDFKIAKKLAKGKIVGQLVDALRDATPVDTGNARDGWRINEDGDIVNDVDYIDILNAGSSQQAPSHFIEQTILDFDGVKPNGVVVIYKEKSPP